MNILITGGRGFMGRSFQKPLSINHNVFAPSHKELDVTILSDIEKFIKNNNIDCIIHTATILSRRYAECGPDTVYPVLLMFENVLEAAKNCKLLINFGSGEELNEGNKTEDKLKVFPKPSSFSKYIITKRILSVASPICFNLRVVGCFGIEEKEDRFIKCNLHRLINKEPIIIHQNRLMDFIYIDDLLTIVQHVINNPKETLKDINCVYTKKYTLLDIAKILLEITGNPLDYPIIIEKDGMDFEYIINGDNLSKLNLQFKGLETGIKEMYEKMREKKYEIITTNK
jgi:nucleoside-diphosphate-sugar epimerase